MKSQAHMKCIICSLMLVSAAYHASAELVVEGFLDVDKSDVVVDWEEHKEDSLSLWEAKRFRVNILDGDFSVESLRQHINVTK